MGVARGAVTLLAAVMLLTAVFHNAPTADVAGPANLLLSAAMLLALAAAMLRPARHRVPAAPLLPKFAPPAAARPVRPGAPVAPPVAVRGRALAAVSQKKAERKRIMSADTYVRNGFKEVRKETSPLVENIFGSEMVTEMKSDDNGRVLKRGNVTVHLAEEFGFCWGVVRSIEMAYEARAKFPDKSMHITNELIHNPEVNDRLTGMGVAIVEKEDDGSKRFSKVQDGDVVVLPAFGASLEEMQHFDKQGVTVVDTTCPWVTRVWNTIDRHQKNGLTSVIHGKYAHEETVATTSFCEHYICVKNMDEAEMLCDYIVNGGDKVAFMKKFAPATSADFDPDVHLQRVGLANQTTMYKKETKAIGRLLERTMLAKFGPEDLAKRYMEFDTICDATQERQDAIHDMVETAEEKAIDFILVVGGWDSSNTAHLLEIPEMAGKRAFHINRADCIAADNTITHRTVDGTIKTDTLLMGDGPVTIGITSGASTPDSVVQEALSNLFMLSDLRAKAAEQAAA